MSEEGREVYLVDLISNYRDEYLPGRKFMDADIEADPELTDTALEYLATYTGNFEFILDIREKGRGNLSTGQARGVLNTMLAEKNRRDNPLASSAIKGIAVNGFYLLPGERELEIREWRDDGTRILRKYDGKRWDGFASINPDHSYRIFGKSNSEENRAITKQFLEEADGPTRQQWQEGWAEFTGKCYIDGRNPATHGGLCETCMTGKWAVDVISREEQGEHGVI